MGRDGKARNLGGETPSVNQVGTHLGTIESFGKLAQQGHSGQWQVTSASRAVKTNMPEVRASGRRLIRNSDKRSTSQILFPISNSGSRGDQCPLQPVAQGITLCFPPSSSELRGTEKDSVRGGESDSPGSTLAEEVLVWGSSEPIFSQALEDSPREYLPVPGDPDPSGAAMALVDCLALERSLLREANFSSRVIRTIEASRQP